MLISKLLNKLGFLGGINLNLLLKFIVSYFALYLVILFHEWGHSFFYWKYDCKDNWIKVTVKPYLFFSTPRPVNDDKVEQLTDKQNLVISYAGIVVNLIVAFFGVILISIFPIINKYMSIFISQFISLHLAEAITYLVIGNIYLVSDMKSINKINPKLRPINFILGLIVSIFYFYYLFQLSNDILGIVILFNLIVIICMGVGRILFTYIQEK